MLAILAGPAEQLRCPSCARPAIICKAWHVTELKDNEPLARLYDVALLDLDGVVYAGANSIEHAAEALGAAEKLGMHLAFVTNNASRPPEAVLTHLTEVGVHTSVEQIITSAQVAARALSENLPPKSKVLVVGDVGLREAVTEQGFELVQSADDQPAAVAQGISTRTTSAEFAEAVVAIRAGALWVASNTDSTLPSPRGPLPGNGAFVELVARTLGRGPDLVAGKPDPTMHAETVRRTGAAHPLVVGDRLDTDIEGANSAGCDSLLVLTGIAQPKDLIGAEPKHRPTYLSADLRGLLQPPRLAAQVGDRFTLGRWTARIEDSAVVVAERIGEQAAASTELDAVDLLVVACTAAWSEDLSEVRLADEQAQAAGRSLGLA